MSRPRCEAAREGNGAKLSERRGLSALASFRFILMSEALTVALALLAIGATIDKHLIANSQSGAIAEHC